MKHIIYKTAGLYTQAEEKETLENMKDQYIDTPNGEIVWHENNQWYDDEYINLNKNLDNRILAIADVGTWQGRYKGYKLLNYKLNSILTSFNCEDYEVYYDGYNVCTTAYHHDGKHYVVFRTIRNEENIDNFLNKIYNQEKVTNSMINYYTQSLKSVIQAIYGW